MDGEIDYFYSEWGKHKDYVLGKVKKLEVSLESNYDCTIYYSSTETWVDTVGCYAYMDDRRTNLLCKSFSKNVNTYDAMYSALKKVSELLRDECASRLVRPCKNRSLK